MNSSVEDVLSFSRKNQRTTGEDFDFLLLHEDGSVTCSEGLEGRLTLSGDWADREIEVVRR